MTRDELNAIVDAQLKHTVNLIQSGHHKTSDDGHDYLTSALRLSLDLLDHDINDSLRDATVLLRDVYLNYACDGVCAEIAPYAKPID